MQKPFSLISPGTTALPAPQQQLLLFFLLFSSLLFNQVKAINNQTSTPTPTPAPTKYTIPSYIAPGAITAFTLTCILFVGIFIAVLLWKFCCSKKKNTERRNSASTRMTDEFTALTLPSAQPSTHNRGTVPAATTTPPPGVSTIQSDPPRPGATRSENAEEHTLIFKQG